MDKIGRITTGGLITEFPVPTAMSYASRIVAGPDGAMWFVESSAEGNRIGRIDVVSGAISEFPIPTAASQSTGIALGPDGAIWFTEYITHKIGRLSVPPSTSPLVAATLPASRSVQVGQTATAFATLINTGSAATSCGIVPLGPVAGRFWFQTTDPATNALTGTPNTRVSIGAGGSQSFVVAFTATGPMPSNDIRFGFGCRNAKAATPVIGLNTLQLTFDANPVPDIVALAATTSGDGIVNIPGPGGSWSFAVASVNVGASGVLTASASAGASTLPIGLTLCETNPATGQCLASPAATVTTTIATNATPTFAVFVEGGGAVPFDPARNRVFVRFRDSGNVVRGSTSVAVRTQ